MTARRRESPRAAAAAQAPRSVRYRHLVNPFEPVRLFSEEQVESMHLAALGILERQGMRVLSPRGRTVLAAAGAAVDEATQMVRLDPGMVTAALTTVPREVNLVAGNPERSCRVGGRHVVFAPVAGPASVSDLGRGKLQVTESTAGRILSLPMFPTLSDAQQQQVVEAVARRTMGIPATGGAAMSWGV